MTRNSGNPINYILKIADFLCQIPQKQQSARDINRRAEEKHIYPSLRITRCEEWSTLREMLPSRGRPIRFEHPKWGTGVGLGPKMVPGKAKRHPIITSAMSRYVSFELHMIYQRFKALRSSHQNSFNM